ncbi:MAG: carbohydrate ABC transporter permease [Clostridia bacterium]|nr:carbohydrate ABC transporter permease [Clostridia bacterium]MBR4442802.1 carbohydrate ABC transporter permease [Clostridia bacterium]
MFLMMYPFWNMVVFSFNDGTDALLGRLYFWPRSWTLSNYEYVFKNSKLLHGALVSVLRVVTGTVSGVVCNALLGYIVSCRHFYGRKFMRLLFIITMYFGGGLIPTYLLMLKLGFMNSFWVYIIPSLFSCYYMLLASSYIQNIPDALFESARIDGASELKTFVRIALPLAMPMLACIAVYIGVGHWNSWFDVSLYSKNGTWDTLQIILYRLLNQANAKADITNQQQLYQSMRTIQPETVRAATTMVVVIPIVFIYPFFQRYFVGGITLGAVKG